MSLLGLAALGAAIGLDFGAPDEHHPPETDPSDPELPDEWLPDEWPPPDAPARGQDTVVIRGGGMDDLIWIDETALVEGLDGNDSLFGGDGSSLSGGSGDDLIFVQGRGTAYGGNGNDMLDVLDGGQAVGGSGNDTIFLNGSGFCAAGEGDDSIFATLSLASEEGHPGQVIAGGTGSDMFALGVDATWPHPTEDRADAGYVPLTIVSDFDPEEDHLSLLVGEFPISSGATSIEASPISAIALSDTDLGTLVSLTLRPFADATGAPPGPVTATLLLAGAHGLDLDDIDILQRGEQGRIIELPSEPVVLMPVDLALSPSEVWISTGPSYVMGSVGDDMMSLSGAAGYVLAGGGDDILTTSSASLIAHSNEGDDVVRQIDGTGNERPASRLFGGSGNDRFEIASGHSTIEGGSGNDTLFTEAGSEVTFDGGAGHDSAVIRPGHRVGAVEDVTLIVTPDGMAEGPATIYSTPRDIQLTLLLNGGLSPPVELTEHIVRYPSGTWREYVYEVGFADGTSLLTLFAGAAPIDDLADRITVRPATEG